MQTRRLIPLGLFIVISLLLAAIAPAFALDSEGDKSPAPSFTSTDPAEIEYDPTVSQILSVFDRVFECHVLAGEAEGASGSKSGCQLRGPCETVTVRCLSPEALRRELERQRLATCDAICSITSCEVFFAEAWCKRIGLRDGEVISVPDLRRRIEERAPTNAIEAIQNCSMQHERKHLEQDARDKPLCLLEQEAYWEQTQCLERYRHLFCDGGRECSQDCLRIKFGGCESEAIRALNGCACQIDPGWCSRCTGAHCDTCKSNCESNFTNCYKPPFDACGATLLNVTPSGLCSDHTEAYCRRRLPPH